MGAGRVAERRDGKRVIVRGALGSRRARGVSAVHRKQFLELIAVGDDVNGVLVSFAAAGAECLEDACGAVFIAAFDAAGGGFESGDVFVFAPVLPIGASGEFFGVVSDGDAESESAVDDGHGSMAVAGGFGIDIPDEGIGATMLGEGIGDAFVVVAWFEIVGGGFATADGFDFLGVIAEFGAGIEEGIAEVDMEKPRVRDGGIGGIVEVVGDLDGIDAEG